MLEIGSLLRSISTERLSLLLQQTSFPFTIHAYYVISLPFSLLNCLLQRYFHLLYYSAITLLATFLLGVSLIYFIQYYSYSAILYSYYNICNSYSYCGHVIHSARDASTRTRLYWDGSTCAQVGLKCSLIQASPNSLTSDPWAAVQQEGSKPNNTKRPTIEIYHNTKLSDNSR